MSEGGFPEIPLRPGSIIYARKTDPSPHHLLLCAWLVVSCASCTSCGLGGQGPACVPESEVAEDCFITEDEIVSIGSNEDLEMFCQTECSKLPGSLYIRGEVDDLSPLRKVHYVNNTLSIDSASQLEDLKGLENLRFAGTIDINFNKNLRSLRGLKNLEEVPGTFDIRNNPALEVVDSLDSLRAVGEQGGQEGLDISENPVLRSIQGFENLEYAEQVGISSNPELETISGFNTLETTDEGFFINRNPVLEKVDGFSSFASTRRLVIIGNPKLPQCWVDEFATQVTVPPEGRRELTENDEDAMCPDEMMTTN
jgi:hypothetical protein